MTDNAVYLRTEAGRKGAILNDLPYKFYFEHQEIADIPEFSNGVFEPITTITLSAPTGSIQVNINLQLHYIGTDAVSSHRAAIESAAAEFGIDADFLKAVIYTENARGWYDGGTTLSGSIRPANISK